MMVSVIALAAAVSFMLAELALSRRNERILVSRGAVAATDPVYSTMQWAYPGAFVAMAMEGLLAAAPLRAAAIAGALIFTVAKVFKFWAIVTLGYRWTYRVLVLPGAPLVSRGPYRLMRHPNYAGVIGELVGMALVTGALWTGPAATLFFAWLLRRRIHAEERALHLA